MPSFLDSLKSIFRSTEEKPQINTAVSNYGTRISGGFFDEDHIKGITGPDGMEKLDKMRRSDSEIQMILSAVKNPLSKAICEIRPGVDKDDERFDEAERVADLCRFIMFEDMSRPWKCVWDEILTFIDFGFSPFWEINKVENHRDFGKYIGIDDLRYISQKSINTWNLDPVTGRLISVEQVVDGDLASVTELPAQFLHIFTRQLEGSNYEGISILRAAYGNWLRKNTYLKLEAIGLERSALGFPTCTVPTGIADQAELDRMKSVLQKIAVHEASFAMIPAGWAFDLKQMPFSSQAIKDAIEKENVGMIHAVAANFLALGQNGGGGSYSLGSDLSDFFFNGIEYLAKIPEQVMQAGPLRRLTRMNFGPDAIVPKFCVSGIKDDTGKELAEVIQILKNAGAFGYWSDSDSKYIRKRFQMPEMEDAESQDTDPGEVDDEEGGNEDEIEAKLSSKVSTVKLSAKPRTLMVQGAEGLADLMRANLTLMKDKLVHDLVSNWERLPESSKPDALKSIEASGVTKYKESLHSAMISLATKALNQVTDENKWISTTKFDLRFADPLKIQQGWKVSDFKRLPRHVKKSLKQQADLIAETQAADLEKAIAFQYSSSISVTDSPSILANDLDEAAVRVLGSIETAADVVSAKIVNETRHFFFFDDEVIEQIESFTFRNPDPVTDICQSLNGRVFSKIDGESLRYEPPLHWNCKSYLEANAQGSGALEKAKEDGMDGLRPSKTLQKQITLADKIGHDLAAHFSSKWVAANVGMTHEIQAISFDPKEYSCQSAESFASSLNIEVSRIAMKGERLFGEVKEPRHFESLHVVNIDKGVKVVLGVPKGSLSDGPTTKQ